MVSASVSLQDTSISLWLCHQRRVLVTSRPSATRRESSAKSPSLDNSVSDMETRWGRRKRSVITSASPSGTTCPSPPISKGQRRAYSRSLASARGRMRRACGGKGITGPAPAST